MSLITILLASIPVLSGNARGSIVSYLKLSDVMLLLLASYLILTFGKRTILIDQIGNSLLIFTIIGIIMSVVNVNERTDLSSNTIIKSLFTFPQYLAAYLVSYWLAQKKVQIEYFAIHSIYIATIISFIAILQYFDIGPTRQLLATWTDNPEISNFPNWKNYRTTSIFYSWHALSMYLSMNLILLLHLIRYQKITKKYLLLLPILAIALVSSLTISPVILALIGLFHFRYANLRNIVLVTSIGAVITIFVTNDFFVSVQERINSQFFIQEGNFHILPQTLEFRLEIWKESIFPIILENFWSGYGFSDEGSFGFFRYTESMYFYLLLTGGIFLLLAFLFMQIQILYTLRNTKSTEEVGDVGAQKTLKMITMSLVILSFIHPYFTDTGPAFLYFILIGLNQGSKVNHVRTTIREK